MDVQSDMLCAKTSIQSIWTHLEFCCCSYLTQMLWNKMKPQRINLSELIQNLHCHVVFLVVPNNDIAIF